MADQKTFERVCDVIRETAGLDDVEMKPESTLEENVTLLGALVISDIIQLIFSFFITPGFHISLTWPVLLPPENRRGGQLVRCPPLAEIREMIPFTW